MENKFCTLYIHEVCDFKTVGGEEEDTVKGMSRATDPAGPLGAPAGLQRWLPVIWLRRLGAQRVGARSGWAREHLWWRAGGCGPGLSSGVRVDGGDVTQAGVEGPVGEEAAVLRAAGHDVCGRLRRQRGGARGLGQSLVACVGHRVGHRVRLENSGVVGSHLSPAPRRHPPA